MTTPRKLLFAAALFGLLAGCSDPAKPGAGGPQGPAGGTKPDEQQVQDPVEATLVEALLARRKDGESIYVADCTKKPESEDLGKIKATLRDQSVKFIEPIWANYQYYLNRVIPETRRQGRVWLVYDHKLEKLTKVLKEGYLDHHHVAFQHQFDNATLALVTNEFADTDEKPFVLEPVYKGSGVISNIVFTPDGKYMLVTTKGGNIRWQTMATGKTGTVKNMPRAKKGKAGVFSGGESGMIGMALHPKFTENNKIYLHYNWRDEAGNRRAVLTEWTVDLSKAPSAIAFNDERKLLTIEQVHDNHNAGCLKFGPDGYLYIGIGDGEQGKWTIGRSPAGSLRGKVLRIDVDKRDEGKEYAVPSDNPFVGNSDFPPETWAWGFRNPWRLSFVPDGRLIASDIGEDVNEELTFVVKGSHHGWPYYEGNHSRNPWKLDVPLQPPLVPYGREFGMSVIAGGVYSGEALPELAGKFVFCDYMSGRIWAFDLPETDATLEVADLEELTRWPLLLPTITRSPDGELFFGAHNGEVLKLVRGSANAAATTSLQPASPADARRMFGAKFAGSEIPESTPAQAALGRRLFSDKRLSADGSQSCATCHNLDKYGQDGRDKVAGAKGPARNTPSVFNLQPQFSQFRDYRSASIEDAVQESLTYHMGHASVDDAVKAAGKIDGFADAFPGAGNAVTAENIALSIGAFLRQLETPSRWTRFLDGDDKALSELELKGVNAFSSVGCTSCHLYRGLGGGMPQKLGLMKPWTGEDKGRYLLDQTPGQDYFFKVPTLFNVGHTAPYYHDGSIKTLAEAVRNMAKIQLMRDLSDEQVTAIVAFLRALDGDKPAVLK